MVRAISPDSDNGPNTPTQTNFTPSRATQMLPLVRRIVRDILQLQEAIDVQTKQLEVIDSLPDRIEQADYREEVSDIRESLADDQQRLDDCFAELLSLGVEWHHPFSGAVDFPAECNRRSIRLCWIPGDEEVMYFHEPGQDPSDRKKIDPDWFGAESLN